MLGAQVCVYSCSSLSPDLMMHPASAGCKDPFGNFFNIYFYLFIGLHGALGHMVSFHVCVAQGCKL